MSLRVLDGPAKRAGIEDGDRIVAVDEKPVADWTAMRDAVREGAEHTLTVERNGQRITRVVTPNDERRIGVERQASSIAKRPLANHSQTPSQRASFPFAPCGNGNGRQASSLARSESSRKQTARASTAPEASS